jgi:pre-mRNA-processing factor 6
VCRLFWADRIVDKARSWFNRAVKLDPDNGDAWAYFLRFEIEQGTDASRQELIARAVQAEPRHGLVWPTVAKAAANARKSTEEILAHTAAALDAAAA